MGLEDRDWYRELQREKQGLKPRRPVPPRRSPDGSMHWLLIAFVWIGVIAAFFALFRWLTT
jgi:hypothetical protein